MSLNCYEISADIVAAICQQPPTAGTGDVMYIMNFDDVDKANSTISSNVISSILMDSGKTAYSFSTIPDSVMGSSSVNVGTYFTTIQQDVILRAHAKTEAAKAFINNALGSKLMVIVQNREIGSEGEVKWELYGWDSGLEVTALESSTDMADETVYSLTVGSGERSKEGTLPKSVWDTDISTTEAMLASLLSS